MSRALAICLILVAGCNPSNKSQESPTTQEAKSPGTSPDLPKAAQDFLTVTSPAGADARDASFSPDGSVIVVGAGNVFKGEVSLHESKTGKRIRAFPSSYGCAAFTSDGKLLATAAKDCAKIWETETGKERVTLPGYDAMITRLAFSPDDKYLATASYDGTVKIWEWATSKNLKTLRGPILKAQSNWVLDVAWSKDGKRLAAAGHPGVMVWDPQTGNSLHQSTPLAMCLAFSTNSKTLASVSRSEKKTIEVRLRDMENGNEKTIPLNETVCQCIAFHPDGKRLIVGDNDGNVRSIDPGTGKVQTILRANEKMIGRLTFAPDGKTFATACSDGTVRIWDTAKLDDGAKK